MRVVLGFLSLFGCHLLLSQGISDEMKETERMLAASTKQVNQFFLRFNGEEGKNGHRLYQGDKHFRSTSIRKKMIPNLFDQLGTLDQDLAETFAKMAVNKNDPQFIDKHETDWFAEVNVDFEYNEEDISGLIYFKLEQQGKGYAWIIEDVSFEAFKTKLTKDQNDHSTFIHPMSHELGFMTLRKAFQNDKEAIQYTSNTFSPDYLTIFLHEIVNENLKFKTVKSVKFHFFVFVDWYFSLSYFNRNDYNSGWLIDNIFKFQNDSQKEQLRRYVLDKDN